MSEIAMPQGRQVQASSRADRPTSFRLEDMPIPHGREEDWRFTPLERLGGLLDAERIEGTYLPQVRAEDSVLVEAVGRDDPRLGTVQAPGDRAAVVAWNTFEHATVVTVPTGTHLQHPVYVRYNGPDDGKLYSNHLFLDIQEGAHAQLIIEHTGNIAMGSTVEVRVGEDARLELASLQEWDRRATHAVNHRINLGAKAFCKHIVVTLGGDLVRVCPDVNFVGEGADVEMLGLYFTDTAQHHEHRLYVDHALRNCRSRVTYKGALQGQDAHAVWIGDVLIGPEAFGTDSYEHNRNLVLNEGAIADSVPNLEIENGDIEGAGHASATGRFDDEQLFYLRSRGIPEKIARKLVVHGFFAELVKQIQIPSIEERLLEVIDQRLEEGGHL